LDCFGNANGGWGFPALWIVGLIALALTGDRAHTLRPGHARADVR
jgi:putative oxidoreductase